MISCKARSTVCAGAGFPVIFIYDATNLIIVYPPIYNRSPSRYSHWLVSAKVSTGANFASTNFAMSVGILTLYIPRLISTDALQLFYGFNDGNSGSNTEKYSQKITLSLSTKSSTSSTSTPRDTILEYSALLSLSSLIIFS